MARKQSIDSSLWPALTIEGHLISPAMLMQISKAEAPGQKPADYRLRKGIEIKNEISNAFAVGQAHYLEYKQKTNIQTWDTFNFIEGILREAFGFDDLVNETKLNRLVAGKRVPIRIGPLDTRLNVETESELSIWQMSTDGKILRLMRDSQSLTRSAYIDADIQQMFENEDIASFRILWLLIHRTRFGYSTVSISDCTLERWREKGASEGEVARDRLAEQVKVALTILGNGFLKSNPEIKAKLQEDNISLTEWTNELLRLVYRLIFVMVAEERNLLHPKTTSIKSRAIYKEGYSLIRLRSKCIQNNSWNKHKDCYETTKIVFSALSSFDGEPAIALPALGGLFNQRNLPTLANATLTNKWFLEALFKLNWLQNNDGIVAVNWRDMKIEELGSIYESLLELKPQLGDDGNSFQFANDSIERKGSPRKTTGSYYTHPSLVQALLKSTLVPVLDKVEAEASDKVEAILKLNIIDPACGSGHFLLAAANLVARRIDQIQARNHSSQPDYQDTLRKVVRRCIFGVDVNPMAIEIVKFGLWIETLTPGLPLGFLDGHIRCGDSLLGIFDLEVLTRLIPDEAYKPLIGDNKEIAKHYLFENRKVVTGQGEFDFESAETIMPPPIPEVITLASTRRMPEDSTKNINLKEEKFEDYVNSDLFMRWRNAADLYIAAFILPKRGEIPSNKKLRNVPVTADMWKTLNGVALSQNMKEAITEARTRKAFHWPLEFLDVIKNGGFDVVVGNPPWERIKLQFSEFFATDTPEIANASNASIRNRLIEQLRSSENTFERSLHRKFIKAKRLSEAKSAFVRLKSDQGGRYPYTGRGDVNTYALFAELFCLLRSTDGRAGIITPTGIANDFHTSLFFNKLVKGNHLLSLFDFENREKLFSAVTSQMKFSLLTIGNNANSSRFASFLTNPTQINDPDRIYDLNHKDINLINPNTKTAPVFRSKFDGELAKSVYGSVPVMINEKEGKWGNPWGVRFVRMYDMANDSHLFYTTGELKDNDYTLEQKVIYKNNRLLRPLYEAKLIQQYDHRYRDASGLMLRPKGSNWPKPELDQKKDTMFEVYPWYWVDSDDFKQRLRNTTNKNFWITFRSIARAIDERTLIATALYSTPLSGKLTAITTTQLPEKDACLLGMLNSLILDFIVRLKIGGTDLAFHYVKQFPVLPPEFFSDNRVEFLVPKVLELVYTSYSLKTFAEALNYKGEPFEWNEERRAILRAELDAFFAKAYGLNKTQLRYILDPSDVKGSDYPSETFRVLKKNELMEFGEYRTQKLVLAAWDRLESEGIFRNLGM